MLFTGNPSIAQLFLSIIAKISAQIRKRELEFGPPCHTSLSTQKGSEKFPLF